MLPSRIGENCHIRKNLIEIVTKVVSLCCRMDFYIIAQTVRAGTVAPTYYNVLYDSTKLTIDQLQQLTYAQCCMYFNWTVSGLKFWKPSIKCLVVFYKKNFFPFRERSRYHKAHLKTVLRHHYND